MNYVFDIDGTLTPSRLPIDKKFEQYFFEWMQDKNVYFVTGSDKDKTIEQIGERIWKKATRCYQSCGNAVYENGKLIHQLDFNLDTELTQLLNEFLDRSNWKFNGDVYSNHIESRIGLINFSTIGRSCTQEAREKYYEYDNSVGERKLHCQLIEDIFPHLEAAIGGQISIDIYPKGMDKSQVLNIIEQERLVKPDKYIFIGDRIEGGGNDYPLAKLMNKTDNCSTFQTDGWEHTIQILENLK